MNISTDRTEVVDRCYTTLSRFVVFTSFTVLMLVQIQIGADVYDTTPEWWVQSSPVIGEWYLLQPVAWMLLIWTFMPLITLFGRTLVRRFREQHTEKDIA